MISALWGLDYFLFSFLAQCIKRKKNQGLIFSATKAGPIQPVSGCGYAE